jgi:uncharacterized membrane protein YphA (DoxX/SURF4 family)
MQNYLHALFDHMDVGITRWLSRYSIVVLRIGLGVTFLWFGMLKFFPNLSPAQDLAARTIDTLTFGLVPAGLSVALLATLECAIGLGLITGKFMRLILLLLALQMVGAASPLVFFPSEVFNYTPYAPTLEGQYILKNIVLIGAALVLGSTVRGGHIVAASEEEIWDKRHGRGKCTLRLS